MLDILEKVAKRGSKYALVGSGTSTLDILLVTGIFNFFPDSLFNFRVL